jgi:HK97 family phage prohead protease
VNDIIEARKALYGDKPIERRLRPFEVREWDFTVPGTDTIEAKVGLRGYASTTEEPYPVTDWLGEYQETICRGAFTKALQERQDVRLLVNHDGIPVARTKSGTMTLAEDDRGLLVDVPSLDTDSPLVQTMRSAMVRGDLDQMSFSFRATRQEWNEDYTERFVREVKLYDVSVVTYPANEGTDVKLRGALPFGTLDRLAAGAPLTDEDRAALQPLLLDNSRLEEAPEAPTPDSDGIGARARRLAQLRALAASL